MDGSSGGSVSDRSAAEAAPGRVSLAAHLDALDEVGSRLSGAAAAAGLAAAVPHCPGWSVGDLVRHVGGVHRWAATVVGEGRREPPDGEEQAALFAAPEDAGLLAWFDDGRTRLLAELRAADADLSCWSFLPAPSPLAFWGRRQAHETAVHCADAESAAGMAPQFPPELAADGIDELLTGFLARPRGRLVADPPRRLAVMATDTGDCWTMRIEPDRRVVSAVPAGGTAAAVASAADLVLRGPASALYLMLWNRGAEGVDAEGDAGLLDLWRGTANIRWG